MLRGPNPRLDRARSDLDSLEQQQQDLDEAITAQEETLGDLRTELSGTSLGVAQLSGLNRRVAEANSTLHQLRAARIRSESRLRQAREDYERAQRAERNEWDRLRLLRTMAELMQAEVDGLRRALAECEKQCKSSGSDDSAGAIGGGSLGEASKPASTRCFPCAGTAKAINSAMDDLRSLRSKKTDAEGRQAAAREEFNRLYRNVKAIEAGGSKAARDEQRHLGSLRTSLERAREEWMDAGREVTRLDEAIENKKAELASLLLYLSECEKKCRLGTKTSWRLPGSTRS